MSRYIESFLIGRYRYSIEDYEDGEPLEEHFFGFQYAKGECKRFRLWRNGGGFGQVDTLEEARRAILDYAVANIENDLESARRVVAESEKNLALLGDDTAHLFRFEEKS